MQPERAFCVGSHPCRSSRKTSSNGWAWALLSTGSLKFRQLKSDGANEESEGAPHEAVALDGTDGKCPGDPARMVWQRRGLGTPKTGGVGYPGWSWWWCGCDGAVHR